MPAEAKRIFLPQSYNDRAGFRVAMALRQYDERLVFGRNEDTGQWCIFTLMPREAEAQGIPRHWPVIGYDEIPEPDKALHDIRNADLMRNGDRIRSELEREARRSAQAREDAASAGSEIAAEAAESFMHRIGKTPYHRSLRKRDPKQRSSS